MSLQQSYLGGGHLPHHLLLELPDLALVGAEDQLHLDLVPVGLLDHALHVLLLRVGDVGRALGVVGLLGDLLLDLVADEEEGCRVRVVPDLHLDLGAGHRELEDEVWPGNTARCGRDSTKLNCH